MNELIHAAEHVLSYPEAAPPRRHGPQGYSDYGSYKPWLRDEFAFRCVYCLSRETWKPDGHEGFSVEHIAPRATHPEAAREYDNLLYACVSCNARRQCVPLPIDPSRRPLGGHLRIDHDGTAQALTAEGQRLIDLCRLNRTSLRRYRWRLLRVVRFLSTSDHSEASRALAQFLSFPEDLPDLASLRPPGGNTRPKGLRSVTTNAAAVATCRRSIKRDFFQRISASGCVGPVCCNSLIENAQSQTPHQTRRPDSPRGPGLTDREFGCANGQLACLSSLGRQVDGVARASQHIA